MTPPEVSGLSHEHAGPRGRTLTNYFEVAQHLGLNPQPLLHRVNLSRKLIADPEQRIPFAAAMSLLEESARVTGCSTFGLRMAESRQLADLGVVSLLLTHQRTLRDALQVATEYRHLLNESLAIHIEDAGQMVVLREEVVLDFPTSSRQGTELAIGVLFRLCAALLGAHWRPQSVNFTHAAPADLQLHRRIFKCKVEFDAEFNGIVCRAADLDHPSPLADQSMARYAARFIDSLPGAGAPSIVLEVRKAIYVGLPMGRATIEQIAQALGMNVRTLQRRLEDRGRHVLGTHQRGAARARAALCEELALPAASHRRAARLFDAELFRPLVHAQFGVAPRAWRKAFRQRG